MAQRINISIPDKLSETLDSYKARLNVSRICQDAILNAVQIEELKDEISDDIEKLAVRLKKERGVHVEVYEQEGFRDGTKDAFKLGYEDFAEFEILDGAWTDIEIFQRYASETTKIKFDDPEGKSFLRSELSYPEIDFRNHEEAYLMGWISGLNHVWSEVQKKI